MKETGIQKNIGNFAALITYCKSYGEKYNPSNPGISLKGLELLLQKVREKVKAESETKTQFLDATNERVMVFDGLDILATRVLNALRSSGASKAKIDDVNAHNRKIHGSPAKGKGKAKDAEENKEEGSVGNEAQEEDNTRSTSQQSFDNMVGHFAGLIESLKTETKYNPNEEEYKVSGLEKKLADMESANETQKSGKSIWTENLIARNKAFNDEETGLIAISKLVKAQVKYHFKANSQEFKHISKLQFRKIIER